MTAPSWDGGVGRLYQRCAALIRKQGYATFARLAWEFPEHFKDGDIAIVDTDRNIVIWTEMSDCGATVARLMIKDFNPKPCSILFYWRWGRLLRLPRAKLGRTYERSHWLPIVFRRVAP